MNFSRVFCTERECISVSVDAVSAASADRPIIIQIQSAKNIAEEAFGPNASCEFEIGPVLARRWAATVFAAHIASAAHNPNSELLDDDETDENTELFLDAYVVDGGRVELSFEVITQPPARAFRSLEWQILLNSKDAAQLAEALLSASKIASQERVIRATGARS